MGFFLGIPLNKYLTKVSEWSEENKQVAKVFASSWLPSIPGDILGGAAGAAIGSKFKGFTMPKMRSLSKVPGISRIAGHHVPGSTIGGIAGASLLSGAAELVGLKHSLHGKLGNPNLEKSAFVQAALALARPLLARGVSMAKGLPGKIKSMSTSSKIGMGSVGIQSDVPNLRNG